MRVIALAMLTVILGLGVVLPAVRADTGPALGVMYTWKDHWPVTFSWDVSVIPDLRVSACGLGALDNGTVKVGAAVTAPLSLPGDWLAGRLGVKWSDAFEAILQHTELGPAYLAPAGTPFKGDVGLLVKWSAFTF